MSRRVSVIVPTLGMHPEFSAVLNHNAGRLDRSAELVVVLSGPQAREPAHLPAGAKLVRETVPGLAAARERGMRESSGEVCLFLDDDAAWMRGGVEDLELLFARNSRIGACGFNVRNRVPEGLRDKVGWMLDLLGEVDTDGAFRVVRMDKDFHIVGAALAVRRAAWDRSGCSRCCIRGDYGRHPMRGDDLEIQHRLIRDGWRVVAHPGLLAEHRPHPERFQRGRMIVLAYWSCAGGAVARVLVYGVNGDLVRRRRGVALWRCIRARAALALRGPDVFRIERWAMHLGEVHGYWFPRETLRAERLPRSLARWTDP